MSAYWKIPLQLLVLLLGVLVFVFYVFTPPPLLFSSAQVERLRAGAAAPAYAALEAGVHDRARRPSCGRQRARGGASRRQCHGHRIGSDRRAEG